MGKKIDTNILDDLSARFIINSLEFITLIPEEYFFILEEAYWFALDFFSIADITLSVFVEEILSHNNIHLDVNSDYVAFKKYKQEVKVYGTMIFNSDMTHCLLVKQKGASTAITFPKGKKSKNETGIECAIRETKEEVGYDVSNKITKLCVNVFNKITLYFVFNVALDTIFSTQTREEIEKIFWFNLKNVHKVKYKKDFRIFYVAYTKASKILANIKKDNFNFDKNKIITALRTVNKNNRKVT